MNRYGERGGGELRKFPFIPPCFVWWTSPPIDNMAGLTRKDFMCAMKDLLPVGPDVGLEYFMKWDMEEYYKAVERVTYSDGEDTDANVVIVHIQLVHGVLQSNIKRLTLVDAGIHLNERFDLMEKCHVPSTSGTTRSKKLVGLFIVCPTVASASNLVACHKKHKYASYEECMGNIGRLIVNAVRNKEESEPAYVISVSHDLQDPKSPFFSKRFSNIYTQNEQDVFLTQNK